MSPILKRLLLAVVVVLFGNPTSGIGQSVTIVTFAGQALGGCEDGTGSGARFSVPSGVASDKNGYIYVADSGNHTVRKITPAGAVTTLAGLAGASGTADGMGSAARFNHPIGIAVDGRGNVYIADSGNHSIRQITESGFVSTLAGTPGRSGSADGPRRFAQFDTPWSVATDGSGNVYVADTRNNTIRKITPEGKVSTLAGLPNDGSGSVDGIGSAARFAGPSGVATDSSGNLYVADTANDTIRKITPAGEVTTLAGLARNSGSVDGPGSAARFMIPRGVATDSSGNVYVAEEDNNTVRKITPAGFVTTLAGLAGSQGSVDGMGSVARFFSPIGVATDASGNVYVAEAVNSAIRQITPAGLVKTFAGLGGSIGSADGAASAARFRGPTGVAIDRNGNIYVTDRGNSTIRKISPAGIVTTLAGLAANRGSVDGTGSAARFNFPYGVATDDDGNVYVADMENHTIRTVTPAGVVTTLAGLAGSVGNSDGTGSAARFHTPTGVATDNSGNIYVADSDNQAIRKITPAGVVTTLATGFDEPSAVVTDAGGNVYVADADDCTIRKITAAGTVTTIAGLSRSSGSNDGIGSAARFTNPIGLAIDSNGNLYVADSMKCFFFRGCVGNNTIRKITPAGAVTTVAGLAGSSGSADGTGSAARFTNPSGMAIDSGGNLYVADGNNAIRVGIAAIADVARIDASAGSIGVTRLLDTVPQTATAWQWSVIRRPVDSAAELSSATVQNPTFTPDVPGLFTFRLIATEGERSSITTVDFMSLTSISRRRAVRH